MMVTPGSKLHAVYVALRDAGGRALTLDEIAARAALDGGPRQIAPLIWWLEAAGYVAIVRTSPWWARRYCVRRLHRFFDV